MTKPGHGGSAKPAKPEPTQGCKAPRSLSGVPASATARWGGSWGWLCCQSLSRGRGGHGGSKLNFDKRTFTRSSGWPKDSKGNPLCPSCQPKPKGKEESAGSGDRTRLRMNVTPDMGTSVTPEAGDTVRLTPAQPVGGGSIPGCPHLCPLAPSYSLS